MASTSAAVPNHNDDFEYVETVSPLSRHMERPSLINMTSRLSHQISKRDTEIEPSNRLTSFKKASNKLQLLEVKLHWRTFSQITWTVIDEIQLTSVDNLHRKSREYFKNIHTISPGNVKEARMMVIDPDDSVFCYACFDKSMAAGLTIRLRDVRSAHLATTLSHLRIPDEGVLWISLQSISCLNELKAHFKIHDLITTFFSDFRAHSSCLPLAEGFLLSICFLYLEQNHEAVMRKFFVFLGPQMILTVRYNSYFYASRYLTENRLVRTRHHANGIGY